MAGYIGRTPLSEAVQSRAKYTATAGQTTFSFAYQPGFLDVYLNGIKLEDTTDYVATTGTDIVLTTGASAGQVLEAVGLSTFSLVNGKMNYSATTAPTTGDDSSEGYRIGSMWIDTTNDEVYRCTDDTSGAAVWIGTTLEVTDLGSLATVTPTGTGSATTFLAGDNSWKTVDLDSRVSTGGDTISGDIGFIDGAKATFGNSNDLEIYHSGSNSWIRDTGAGVLVIDTNGSTINLQGSGPSELMARFYKDGPVQLYYNNSRKLVTTSTGIDITGGVISSGTTVIKNASTDSSGLLISQQPGDLAQITNYYNGALTLGTNNTEKLRIDSTGNVGIGTSAPSARLEVHDSSGSENVLELSTTNSSCRLNFSREGAPTAYIRMTEPGALGTSDLRFGTGSGASPTERMRIDSSGNVGIGTSSPDTKLYVSSAADNNTTMNKEGSSTWNYCKFRHNGTGTWSHGTDGSNKYFIGSYSGGYNQRLTIDGSGNVGIGITSPTQKLDVAGTVKATAFVGKGAGNQYSFTETVSRASNAPEEWYKVWTAGGGSLSFDIQIEVGGDNTACMDRFTVALSGYGMPANIVRYPGTRYNGSKLLEIITVAPSGSAREVWVRVASMNPSDYTGADGGFLTVRSNQGGVIPLANPQASKPAQNSYDTSLVVTTNTRSAYSLSTSRGIEVGGYVTAPNQPAFHARNIAGGHAYGDVFPITWDAEEYDTGNNWTGSRFTAPITGKYSFSLQIMYKHVGGDWMLNTYKNGSVYGRNNDWQLSSNGNPWVSNSSTDIIHLNAGDYMEWGVATSGNTGSHIYGVGNYTRISGYLLG